LRRRRLRRGSRRGTPGAQGQGLEPAGAHGGGRPDRPHRRRPRPHRHRRGLRHPARPAPHVLLHEREVTLHDALQALLDRTLHWPQWAGLALLALAAVITIPGRHGQRPLNAALLGAGAASALFFPLRGATHAWIPGVAAIVAFVLAALFGLLAEGWATSAVVALIFAGAGSLVARAL